MIRVLAHRGLWDTPEERNSFDALVGSLSLGLGVETDVRDVAGRLVVSHDPPRGTEATFADLVEAYAGSEVPLAVNVKADGLSDALAEHLGGTGIDWFAFDMSVPEMVRYARAALPYFTRHSDVEPDPVLYDGAVGVWLDAFASDWFGPDEVRRHLDTGKRVVLVSPELHGRSPEPMWEWLLEFGTADDDDLLVCSDHPRRLSRILEER